MGKLDKKYLALTDPVKISGKAAEVLKLCSRRVVKSSAP